MSKWLLDTQHYPRKAPKWWPRRGFQGSRSDVVVRADQHVGRASPALGSYQFAGRRSQLRPAKRVFVLPALRPVRMQPRRAPWGCNLGAPRVASPMPVLNDRGILPLLKISFPVNRLTRTDECRAAERCGRWGFPWGVQR